MAIDESEAGLKLNGLLTTQNRLRSRDQVREIAILSSRGVVFHFEKLEKISQRLGLHAPSLIGIVRFPDGAMAVHDGHHRSVGILLSGRTFLHPEEFFITDRTYDQYREINIPNEWYTPFDIATQVRKPDFGEYRRRVLELLPNPEMADRFIREHPEQYREQREIQTIDQLARAYADAWDGEEISGISIDDRNLHGWCV